MAHRWGVTYRGGWQWVEGWRYRPDGWDLRDDDYYWLPGEWMWWQGWIWWPLRGEDMQVENEGAAVAGEPRPAAGAGAGEPASEQEIPEDDVDMEEPPAHGRRLLDILNSDE